MLIPTKPGREDVQDAAFECEHHITLATYTTILVENHLINHKPRDQLSRYNPIVFYRRKKITQLDHGDDWSQNGFIYSPNLFTVDRQNADFMHAGKQDYPASSRCS